MPVTSVTVALTLMAPLAQLLRLTMSEPLRAQVPSSCTTAVLVKVLAAVSVNTTLTS